MRSKATPAFSVAAVDLEASFAVFAHRCASGVASNKHPLPFETITTPCAVSHPAVMP
jgi:hypothetical protein